MKIVALVPFWEEYESNEFRVKKISGRFLLSYLLEKLNKVQYLDDIFVYSSNDSVGKYIETGIRYSFLQRPESLDNDNTTIEEVVSAFLKVNDADVILLLHPTSPLLKISSINKCVKSVRDGGYDSSFAAVEYKKFAWYNEHPINYSLQRDVPRHEDICSIYMEQSSLFVFTRTSFLNSGHRISGEINISEIGQVEGLEVRNQEDFELLELIINSGMYEDRIYE